MVVVKRLNSIGALPTAASSKWDSRLEEIQEGVHHASNRPLSYDPKGIRRTTTASGAGANNSSGKTSEADELEARPSLRQLGGHPPGEMGPKVMALRIFEEDSGFIPGFTASLR